MKRALIGNGGHSKEVMAHIGDFNMIRFVSDIFWKNEPNILPLSKFNPEEYEVLIAISNSKDRYNIVQNLSLKTKYFTYIDPTVIIMDNNIKIGEGSFIGAYSILTTNIKIGKHAILNRGNHIGHDTQIGDYFSAMPGAIISGNVTIYDLVYIGTNASIKEKLSIHNSTIIGSNSTVVKNIQQSGVYAGVPAKKIK
jgi:sugar O-acyltransferase (sialic acid O-acetyltransferase NeuD family)